MAAGRHLGFGKPEIAPFDPPSPKIKEIIGKAVGTWSVDSSHIDSGID